MKYFKPKNFKMLFLFSIILATSVISSEFSYKGPELKLDYNGPIIVDNSHYKYTASDRLTFYTEDYLKQNIPNLLPIREAIDTWAAMFAIHPRLLSDVMQNYFQDKSLDESLEFKQKVFEIASGLSESYRQDKDNILAASKAVQAIAKAYEFELNLNKNYVLQREMIENDYFKVNSGPPLFSYFQPPWPRGEFWSGGGAHTYTGSGTAARNSLDFFKSFIGWDEDTSGIWVNAAQRGIVRVFSSCNINIIHPNGWVTSYYHL